MSKKLAKTINPERIQDYCFHFNNRYNKTTSVYVWNIVNNKINKIHFHSRNIRDMVSTHLKTRLKND